MPSLWRGLRNLRRGIPQEWGLAFLADLVPRIGRFGQDASDEPHPVYLTLPMTDPSFPAKVFILSQQLQREESQAAREKLLLESAEEAAAAYDPTDAGNHEDYHQFFEDFLEARTNYQLAGFRLGRLVSQTASLIRQVEVSTNN